MSIDALVPEIEAARHLGAIVLLKWDGERRANRCTVLVSHPPSDWYFRRDTDQPEVALQIGLAEFQVHMRGPASALPGS
jgi:hypothetical protein